MIRSASLEFIDAGCMDYHQALALQEKLVSEKISGTLEKDIVLMLEHPAVFTIGKRGGRENLTVAETFLNAQGIEIVQTKRGGNITFHGPGQLVCYPIVDLAGAGMGVADFVYGLEEIMIKTALVFGVHCKRNKKNHGIWVDDSKLGSIGLSVKRNISFHGTAMNVNLDLTPFSWINPCGMQDVSMTSLQREIEKNSPGPWSPPDTDEVKSIMKQQFQVFFSDGKS